MACEIKHSHAKSPPNSNVINREGIQLSLQFALAVHQGRPEVAHLGVSVVDDLLEVTPAFDGLFEVRSRLSLSKVGLI